MNTASAQLNNYRQSPRKVRLIADVVRGKPVAQALVSLQFANKKAAAPIMKLIQSAAANAKSQGLNADNLVVAKITVDAGKILYRSIPMARGRAFPMRKRTSRVVVEVSEKAAPAEKTKVKIEKTEVREAKK